MGYKRIHLLFSALETMGKWGNPQMLLGCCLRRGWQEDRNPRSCKGSKERLKGLPKIESVQFSLVTQSCLTLCDPMDCSLPGFSVHGIFQARILEWAAISFSRGSPRPRDRMQCSVLADRFFTTEPPRKFSLQSYPFPNQQCIPTSPKTVTQIISE